MATVILVANTVGLYFAYKVGRELGRSIFALLLVVSLLTGIVVSLSMLHVVVLDGWAVAMVRLIGSFALTGVAIRSYLVWR